MSSKIRKNASLASVAAVARKRANAAHAEWKKFQDAARQLGADQFWRQCQANAEWRRFSDLDEIATHLERLSA